MHELLPLGHLLAHAHHLPARGWLFLSSQPRPAALDSLCAVIDLDEVDDADNPPFALEHGLELVLDMGTVRSIANNARQQLVGQEVEPAVLLRALGYYFRNDAFIDLNAERA